MASYYTYGAVPMASDEAPTDEFSPLSSAPAAPTVVPPEGFPRGTIGSLYVPGATIPEGVDPNAPIDLTPDQVGALNNMMTQADLMRKRDVLSFEPGLTSGYMGLGSLEGGLPITPEMRSVQATPAAGPPVVDPALAAQVNLTPEQLKAIENVFNPQVSEEDQAAIAARPRVQALNKISDQLKANDFSGAFQTALEAEKELGGDFFDNIVNPDKMRMLRGPMTADEIRSFYEAIPQKEYADRYVGPGNIYDVGQALERNLAALGDQPGYIDPRGGTKAKGSIVGDIVDIAPYVFAATVAPHILGTLTGAGAAGTGALGSGTAAGTATGAGAAGAGAAGAGGALGAAGAAAALPEIVITAAKLGLTVPQVAALAGATGLAASTLGGSAAAPTPTATSTATPSTPLEEVVVQGTAPTTGGLASAVPALTAAAVPSVLTSSATQPVEPVEDLEEVVVQGTQPTAVSPVDVVAPLTAAGGIAAALPSASNVPVQTQPVEPVEDLEEVVVQATKPVTSGLENVALTAAQVAQLGTTPTTQIADTYQPTEIPEDLEEVVVQGTKPVAGSLSDVIAPLTTAAVADIGKTPTSDILKDYKPTEVPKTNLEKLLDLLSNTDKLGDILKLIGLAGGAAAGAGGKGGAGTTPTGFGGALPKYQLQRTQLQPDIDYYRYGFGPEAKFFEDKLAPLTPPPEENAAIINPKYQPVFAEGGLAAGGRYVDGPGSGRDDKIPALLSDGEYVIDAETLALLGDGSPKEGAKRMDQFRANIRKHKGNALSRGRISPNAKSPSKYMGGGLSR